MLTCHPPSTRPHRTVRCWIYKELALFPSYTCTVCSRQQVPRDHLHVVHQCVCGHDSSPRYGVRHVGGLCRQRYCPRFGRDSRSSASLGGQCCRSNYIVESEYHLAEYFSGPRTCSGAASSRPAVFSTRVVWSRLAELACSHCYCQWSLRVVCPIGVFIDHVPCLPSSLFLRRLNGSLVPTRTYVLSAILARKPGLGRLTIHSS